MAKDVEVYKYGGKQKIRINFDSLYCVYSLYKDNQLLYIGYSGNISIRLAAHISNGILFDSVMILKFNNVNKAQMKEIELIRELQPSMNKNKYSIKKIIYDVDDWKVWV